MKWLTTFNSFVWLFNQFPACKWWPLHHDFALIIWFFFQISNDDDNLLECDLPSICIFFRLITKSSEFTGWTHHTFEFWRKSFSFFLKKVFLNFSRLSQILLKWWFPKMIDFLLNKHTIQRWCCMYAIKKV